MEQEQLPPGAIPKANSTAKFHDSTIFQTTSGSISFSTASHMASTPFQGSTSLHFPPMSVIKRDATHSEESFTKGKLQGEQFPMATSTFPAEKNRIGGPQRSQVDNHEQDESLEGTHYPQVPDEAKVLR